MVDLIIWGPYPTTINKVIGETVGVVQGEEYAMGIQHFTVIGCKYYYGVLVQ